MDFGEGFYSRQLSVNDIDACAALEAEACPCGDSESFEQLHYRLTACPQLSLGIFDRTNTSTKPDKLVAHFIATLSPNKFIQKDDALIFNPPSAGGYQDHGRTVALRSVAVSPEYQNRKLGTRALHLYLSMVRQNVDVDRVILLCHDKLIRFYQRAGFVNHGPSQVPFGSGGWFNMVLELEKHE